MRKVLCLLLSCLLIVSGCSSHITDHCQNLSDEIASDQDMRENYHPVLTPITDVAGECYCHVEDAAILTLRIVIWIGWATIQGMAEETTRLESN